MKQMLGLVGLMAAAFVQAQDLKLNEKDYFERQGINVLVSATVLTVGLTTKRIRASKLSSTASVPFRAEPSG